MPLNGSAVQLGAALDSITETLRAVQADAYARGRAEGRAEALANSERMLLGKRLLNRGQVAAKLGWTERQLDRQRRSDPRFPQPVKLLKNTPQWREENIDRYMDGH